MTRRFQGALAVCALLIAYASLYPFYPLRWPGEGAVAAMFTPGYFIAFDILVNVLAYVPFGMLACHRFLEAGRTRPMLRAVALATALSAAMEVSQLFVPTRVASLYDILSNAAGAWLGTLTFAEPVYAMAVRPLREARDRVFASGLWGDAGLVLLGLWLLAQLNPALPFFGAGNIGEETQRPTFNQELFLGIGVGLSICGFGLFVSSLMRVGAGALRMTVVLLSMALWLKFAAASVMLKPHFSAEWVSAGRVAGLLAGMAAFFPMRRLGRLTRIYLAIVLMTAGALFTKIFGSYSGIDEVLRLFSWSHGQLGGFATLTGYLHELWPFVAVVFLIGFFFHARKVSTMLERTQVLEARDFR
jgi:VanZ family protein